VGVSTLRYEVHVVRDHKAVAYQRLSSWPKAIDYCRRLRDERFAWSVMDEVKGERVTFPESMLDRKQDRGRAAS
jgi:hypothetical protein